MARGECKRCQSEGTLVPLTFDDQPVCLGRTELELCHWCCEALRTVWDAGVPTRPIDMEPESDS